MKNVTLNFGRMFAVAGAMLAMTGTSAFAQDALRVGVVGAATYNYVDAATQKFVQVPGSTGFATSDFSGASEFELFAGLNGEYLFNDMFGAVLKVMYDARCVEKEDNGSTFTPRIGYISIEPGVRINLGMPELHATAGGTVAVKAFAMYDYTPRAVDGAREVEDVDMNNVNDVAFGAWAGVGYDIGLNDAGKGLGWFVTPFVEGSYLFDQKKPDVGTADDEMWSTLSVRGGVQVKLQF